MKVVVRPQNYRINDKPLIEGYISLGNDKQGSGDIAFATLRGDQLIFGSVLNERKVDLTITDFSLLLPNEVETRSNGFLYLRVFNKHSVDCVVDTAYTKGDTTIVFTVNTGAIPDSGFVLIEDEIFSFTKLNATTITVVSSNLYFTINADHATGKIATFTSGYSSALPAIPIKFEADK